MNNKIYIDSYISYGLNRHRRFLKSPRNEDDEKTTIDLETEADVEEFCIEMLMEHNCSSCAIFIVQLNGLHKVFFKFETDEDEFCIASLVDHDRHLFSRVDGDMRFCCYSLLFELEEGVYEIQE